MGNVLESHSYDSQLRALTSEVAGNGTEKYTLNYVSATETDVTDALNHVTKYFYDTSKSRNVVTRVEGSCSCGKAQIQTLGPPTSKTILVSRGVAQKVIQSVRAADE